MEIKATLSETLDETESDSKDIKIAQDYFLKNYKPSTEIKSKKIKKDNFITKIAVLSEQIKEKINL